MVALQDLLDTIAAGDVDDDIDQIVGAVRDRFAARGTWWRVTFDGMTITEDDITIEEAQMIEASTRKSLRNVDPADSVTNAAAIVLIALRTRRGMKNTDAEKYIKKIGQVELMRGCDRFIKDDEPDPKDGSTGATETQPDSTDSPATSH